MDDTKSLREHLLNLLRGGDAHIHFSDLVADFPEAIINGRVPGVPYTPWHVLEHMRLAQWDILRFAVDKDHVSPKFPEGYWPDPGAEADWQMWNSSIASFQSDLHELEDLVASEKTDLHARFPHGDGQTFLRQALLVADHNAYHLGVLTLLKRILTEANT
jgi:hypothetical protein